ncbi:c-type cytochrome [Thiothrix subterranea]|uniref:c-type cytochrome n=1 Tax=Thiothrix subterranea TaxID=2735563 RepID=UPI001D190ED7|nr:c-type cytochrome [Thiothrix subterranea]
MAHSTPKDPMATPMLIGGLVLIGTTVAVLVSNLFTTIDKNSIKGEIDTTAQVAVADANLAPIGKVNAVDKSIVKVARSGEAVYTAVCTSCHAAGVLGAPKIDDKAAWDPRVAQGLDGLMKNAVNGINNMPARGGDPSITDEELTNAIIYMTDKAGHDLSAQAKPAAGAAPAAAVAAAPAAEAAPVQAAAPAAEAAPVQAAAPAAEAAPVQAAAPVAAIDGEKVYKGICFSCHDVGVAGSPKFGDKAAWAPRIATGAEALYASSLNGKGAMPAKGGNPALSDAEVKAAVDYMVANGK